MQAKVFSLAAGALLFSAGVVSAATVTDNLNLRSGPGINYSIIGAMPAGSDIRILRCGPSWCRVAINDTIGYASRQFISTGGPIYAAAPGAGVVAPGYGYTYGYGYGYVQAPYWGYGGWRYNRYHWWNR